MNSRVGLRLICIQLVARFFPFPPLQKLSKISQETASVITKERLPNMNAIQTDENSFVNSLTVFEIVGPTISKCFLSMRACA